jgi:hypothetical protein
VPEIKPNPKTQPTNDNGHEEPNPYWGTHSDPSTPTTQQPGSDDKD